LDERFVAMDWCLSGMAVPTPDYVNQTFFMGFNEPNNLHNCNRDAETAAKYEKHAHTRPSTTAHTPQPSSHWHSASPTLRNSLFASLYLAPPLFDSSLPLVVFALVCVALTLCAPLRRKSCHVPRTVRRAWPTIVANHPHSMLVSPATAGNGVPWFDQFFGNCTKLYGKSGCNISYLAAHDYSCNPGEAQHPFTQFTCTPYLLRLCKSLSPFQTTICATQVRPSSVLFLVSLSLYPSVPLYVSVSLVLSCGSLSQGTLFASER
jgi:hypothetical protein